MRLKVYVYNLFFFFYVNSMQVHRVLRKNSINFIGTIIDINKCTQLKWNYYTIMHYG